MAQMELCPPPSQPLAFATTSNNDRSPGAVDAMFLSGPKQRGVALWSAGGERLCELKVFEDKRIEYMRLTDDGRYLIASGWKSDETRKIFYSLHALRIGP